MRSEIDESLTFNFIPSLKHLLPKYRGLPGYEYCQVATQNQRRAEREGWDRVQETWTYTIRGESGEIDVGLFVRGKPIPGQSHDSGKRRCWIDKTITNTTGLEVGSDSGVPMTESQSKEESVVVEHLADSLPTLPEEDQSGEE